MAQRTALRWKTLSYVCEMESGWIIAVAIWAPMTTAATAEPMPTTAVRWPAPRGSGIWNLLEPQSFDMKNAITETTAQPASTGTGVQDSPTKGKTSARKPMVPTLKAGAMRRARIPGTLIAIEVASPGSRIKSTAVRITGMDCHQDTETPLSGTSEGKLDGNDGKPWAHDAPFDPD